MLIPGRVYLTLTFHLEVEEGPERQVVHRPFLPVFMRRPSRRWNLFLPTTCS